MSGAERVLIRLRRGPATAAELYADTFTVVHSRISQLRSEGCVIECERIGGTGAGSYLYRLISEPARARAAEGGVGNDEAAVQPVQLSLVGPPGAYAA